MIIRKLKLENFKRFADLDLNLDRGINVIVGKNETGKSTLAHAIQEALFTDPATSMQKFQDNYSWSGSKEMRIELEFENQGLRFLLSKDFAKKTALLKNLASEKSINTHKEILQAITELTGIPSKEIFASTAYISQADIAALETNDDFVSAIQNAAGTGNLKVNVQSLIKSLENERKRLRVGLDHPAKYPGPIKQVKDKVEYLQSELAEKKNSWEKVSESMTINKQADAKLKEVEEKISRLNKLIENNKKYAEAKKKTAAD